MTRTPHRSIAVVFVAVLALSIALVGTATVGNAAATITKAQVKKIAKKVATKVVKNAAPTLSVASAQTAGNATTLAGKPASAYLDSATTFVLPTQTESSQRLYSFAGLAPGTYQVSYNVMMQIGGTFPSSCTLYASGTTGNQEAWTYGAQYNGYNSHAATTLLTVAGGPAPTLYCGGADPWSIYAATPTPSRVTFVPVDLVTTGAPPQGAKATAKPGAINAG